MADIGLSAFSLFFVQSESFLSYQRSLEEGRKTSNCHTLFGMAKIPTDNHIFQIEKMIVRLKQEKPTWGPPKMRERLARLHPDAHRPAISPASAFLVTILTKRRDRSRLHR
jgi:hypothetical protein